MVPGPMRTAFVPLLLGIGVLLTGPAAAGPSDRTVYFFSGSQAVPVLRPGPLTGEVTADARTLLELLLAGPTAEERAAGLASPLPEGTELLAVTVSGEEVTVDLRFPPGFLRDQLDPDLSDAIVEQTVKTLHPLGLHHVHVRAEDETGQRLPVSAFLPRPVIPSPEVPTNDEPLPDRIGPAPEYAGQPPIPGPGRPRGALSGKTVWLSAGHGWYWSTTLNRWTTQRGNNYGLVEDFSNAEAVNYYLARYLWNAGAEVWLVRDRAMTEHEVIVDNDQGAPFYTETGSWITSSTPGYGGGTYRWSSTFSTLSATATWRPNLPAAGWYAVWAWYREGANRPTDARYEVHHAGGVSRVSISQEVHGRTWRYLGEYYFQAGTAGHVTLINQSSDTGQAVIADAIRFGGGLGSIAEPGGTSGQPRWEEAAKYWVQYQGAPAEIYASDVTARPLYAEWETAKGYPAEASSAVYISWHTNAGGGTGTESYIHDTEPTPGSAALRDWVHAELIQDLKAAWNPGWVDRGKKSADFGELRELSTIPGVLLEVAFHDTEDPGDADDLREPVFRQIAARAVYQGIVRYFADRQGTPARLLPEPPTHLVARVTGPGQVTVSWRPPPCCDGVVGDAATAYKVYQSADGRGFDNGTQTTSTSLVLTNLPANTLRFFRVTALNEGGESFPTPTVAVRTPPSGEQPSALIVDGFDRLDQTALVPQWESPALGMAQRMFLERMNRYDYAVEHGLALSACGLAFDGATDEAVQDGDVALSDYKVVDWWVGEESTAEAALNDAERARLADYLDAGGGLLISGAEIGYDLVENGRDPAFFQNYLRADYLGDDAQTYDFSGTAGGPFAGVVGRFDDGSGDTYEVGYPDRLAARNGSGVALTYTGGTGDGAAVVYHGDYRLVYVGFPLETVTDPAVRTDLFCRAAQYLGMEQRPAIGTPRLINPGFEGGTGQTAWRMRTPTGQPIPARRDSLPAYIAPYQGDWLAWFKPSPTGTSVLTQAVGLPTGEPTVTLSLAWFVHPNAPPSGNDHLSVDLYSPGGDLRAHLLMLTDQTPAGAWFTTALTLDPYAGEIVHLAFRADTRATDLFLDDIRLTSHGPPGPEEFRALWVDAYHPGIKSRQQIDELIETAQAASLNAIVVQVRRRGDTYYPSAIDPWATDADRSFDALAYLIEKAHGAGIEVHAWATTLALWDGLTPPANPNHTFHRHGPSAQGRDYWLMTSFAGEENSGYPYYSYYLDPGHPDVVDYTVAIYAELASKYDLDGVHLDRVRYPEFKGTYCQGNVWYCQDWGYNPTSVARFQAQTGRSDIPDPLDPAWVQWRRDQVTALVRKIYLTVTAIKPQMRVSAAVSTSGSPPGPSVPWETRTPYIHQLQDWRGWLEEGILDLALPMTYRREDTYASQFDGWIAWEKDHQYGRRTVIGTGLYLNKVVDSMAQWRRARLPSALGNRALGLCGYSYATPSSEGASRRDFVNVAVTEVFTRPALSPDLPWKDSPNLGHLMGTLRLAPPCSTPLDGYRITLEGPQTRILLTDGSGWFGAVDLPPGEYQLAVEVPGTGETITVPVSVVPGRVAQQTVGLPVCRAWPVYLPLVLKQVAAGYEK